MLPLLVTTAWLTEHLGDPDLRLFDCTGALTRDPDGTFHSVSGRARYDAGHIPGADYLDLHDELSDPAGAFMFTAPSPTRFAEVMGRHGVGPGTQVVLYSAERPSWATRVWWLLRLHGFDDAAVLDGGWEAWVREGRPASQKAFASPPATFTPTLRPDLLVSTAEVATMIQRGNACVVNALSQAQYTGGDVVHYGRPGHIPQSVNLPYLDVLEPDHATFLPQRELRRRLAATGALDAPNVVTYCGGGIGATAVAFALALVGRDDVAVYDDSMTGWGADVTLPVERGESERYIHRQLKDEAHPNDAPLFTGPPSGSA